MNYEPCGNCPHLYYKIRTDFYPNHPEYFCGYDDELELIGFVPVKLEDCPLEQEKPPPMHYLIHFWNPELKKWEVVHYSHDIDDMERLMGIYPESAGYVHSIDLKWLKSHDIMKRVQALRERNKLAEKEKYGG